MRHLPGGGEKFWTRREGGAENFGRVAKGGAKNFGLGQFFFKVPKTQFFHVLWVIWAHLIFGSNCKVSPLTKHIIFNLFHVHINIQESPRTYCQLCLKVNILTSPCRLSTFLRAHPYQF